MKGRLLPWSITVLLAASMAMTVRTCNSWRKEAIAGENDRGHLLHRLKADSSYLSGDHAMAEAHYALLAERFGDTGLLIYDRCMDGMADTLERSAEQEAKYRMALARSRSMQADMEQRRLELEMEEAQRRAQLVDSLQAKQEVIDDLLNDRSSTPEQGVLRFPGPKKGVEINYLGEIRDGMANGHGIGVWNTGSEYEGSWRNNRRNGHGLFNWKSGEHYEGTFVNDMRHGFGTYEWRNGQRWTGEWREDERHGEGILYDADGKVRMTGVWVKDKLERPKR